jgi:molybdenum cofactor biosynthesis enzyme
MWMVRKVEKREFKFVMHIEQIKLLDKQKNDRVKKILSIFELCKRIDKRCS